MLADGSVTHNSQLLKHVSKVAPRGIYTSGKGSSGVGLTAAVLRDPVTNDMTLEGGSLVLADMGICCIDEFDKMEDADRTAIHEVMEQQTISIAKAGITTTLNARTAILAAANPAYGRYNTSRSPQENINLPAALMSRFDLLFLLLDRPTLEMDTSLAKHVTFVHMHGTHPDPDNDVLDPAFLRDYIAKARSIEPTVPRDLTEYIVGAYVNMREDEAASSKDEFASITARTLLGILRLSQGLARLRFSYLVEAKDVDEAIYLMHMSKASLDTHTNTQTGLDPISAIYNIIRDAAVASPTGIVQRDDVNTRALLKGFTQADVDECIATYEALNVWMVSGNEREIKLV